MTSVLLALALLFQPDAPTVTSGISHRTNVTSLDVKWRIVRDSRSRTFLEPQSASATGRIRFERERRRIDMPRWTVESRDGRTRPAEADPERARIEFRNVLLEEQLAGRQSTPRLQNVSLIIDTAGHVTGPRLSLLEQRLADAPLWAFESTWPVGRATREPQAVSGEGKVSAITKWHYRMARDGVWEVWQQTESGRVTGIIERENGRAVGQTDFEYGADDDPVPTAWTVQQINASGEPLAWMSAVRETCEIDRPLEKGSFELPAISTDDPPPLDASAIAWRRRVRWLLDSIWLPIALGAVLVLVALRRPRASLVTGDASSQSLS